MSQKEIYLQIIESYCKIPFVKNKLSEFVTFSEDKLSILILNTVIPGTIRFYGHSMSENRNYLDVIKEIIDNLKKSEIHFNEFKNILNNINNNNNQKTNN